MKRSTWIAILSAVVGSGLLTTGLRADTNLPVKTQKVRMAGWTSKNSGKVLKKSSQVSQNVKYICPVGDNYTSYKPGKCPKCGVDLKRVLVSSRRSTSTKTKHISNF
jgi:hypothetical protein